MACGGDGPARTRKEPSDAAGDASSTCDRFLGGRLEIVQPRHGYRAATDPVLLAAAVPARPGQRVLELGCGVGVALLCLGRRVEGLALTGIELQEDYARLARANGARNGIALTVITGDLARVPAARMGRDYDHVLLNPPWFAPGSGTRAADAGRARAHHEETPLAQWIDTATRCLRPGGQLHVIHTAARLPALLAALDGRLGSIAVKPLAARAGRAAGRVILRARKGGRGAFVLHAPLILHRGPRHAEDAEDYTDQARAILRDGAELPFD